MWPSRNKDHVADIMVFLRISGELPLEVTFSLSIFGALFRLEPIELKYGLAVFKAT